MKLNYAFVCEDVRREDNGKLIFIGAYAAQIIVAEMPATLGLVLIVSVQIDESVDEKIGVQVILGDKTLASGTGRLKATTAGNNFVPFGAFPIKIPEAGDLVFQLKVGEGEWQTLLVQPIVAKPST